MARTAQQETELFERMPIRWAVLTLAIPTVISQLIVMVYNLADTWFIGQTGDPAQVAAVTVSYLVFMLLAAFSNLLASAAAVSSPGFWAGKKRTPPGASPCFPSGRRAALR